ncbi:NFX1-type zinc finger-containing protein 1 [Contarinia nasturtii]|uniref:NFX1-type zinc finger-containing protein 1 n=1 Tax=Contarinia nasturtii TaxID=265458 RepID=UPI0012D41A70|nr:NFX1-type zinc finger-containing protein 1 [Contarinia nasturtii]
MEDGRNNKKQNRPFGQKRQNNFRNGDNNGKNKKKEFTEPAGPSGGGNQNNRKKNNEAKHPIGYKTLETVLEKVENDAEFILKLSSKMNGFLLLLDQQPIRPDFMCLVLAALARASKSSTEQDTIQLLVHFYMEIIPKLNSKSNFYSVLKLYISDFDKNLAIHSPWRQKHVEAIQNLLIFLRRLQLTLYQKSFDAVRDLMQNITAQIEFLNRKGNALNEFIVDMMNQLNDSVENFEQMKEETEKIEVLREPPEEFRKIGIYPGTFDILSNHEPFIRKNVIDGKYSGGVEHYLDVQFRLLREDFVRPLRNGITEYRSLKDKPKEKAAAKFRINDLNIYQNVQIYGSKMLHSDQVYFCKFDCTPFKNLRWQFNKRMMSGSLVCLSQDDFETFFFATVGGAGPRNPEKLAKGEFQIKLEIESSEMPEITPLINYVMVESQVYFEAYRHNLKVLQSFGKDNFPLEKYIVNVDKVISPPSYLTKDSVYLISNGLPETDPERKLSPIDMLSNQQWPPREDFKLDESQYEAFKAALTKQMVVIQGPPGTGKTYIGLRIVEVLLANTLQWPILIVCYTNHALDQFLEGILKFCDTNVGQELVRIGGKSQCEALEKFNLSSIKSNMKSKREVPGYIHQGRRESSFQLQAIQANITYLEKQMEHLTDSVLGDELQEVIKNLNRKHYDQLRILANGRSFNEGILNWLGYVVKTDTDDQENNVNNINNDDEIDDELIQEVFDEEVEELDEEDVRAMEEQRFIEESSDEQDEFDDDDAAQVPFQDFHAPINLNNIVLMDNEDADGFQLVKNRRKTLKRQIKQEIKKSETMLEEHAIAVADINTLFPNSRWNLYRLWRKLYMQTFEKQIKVHRDAYRTECLRFNGLRNQEDIEIVKKAKIIGMTTTGAAKYRHIIDGTKPKITIVEEAAEVLEAHIVTALCKQTDHLILIGDHLQLRPNPAVFELAKKFNLEISLFERLIKNQMEYYQLKQQHRMRPCISSLLVPHIYKQLLDHPSVEKYEDVKGISKNMFFINHCKNEASMQETRSHLNVHEAEFIVELCRYTILQGYETSQVTILTTYSGQLHEIRKLMRAQHLLRGIRAAVVDNYQGEECDIILLSFVRSNEEGNIGFLKDSHRVNVALSRARKGLYCIGNFDCLAEKSSLWKKLLTDLTTQDAIGNALEIYCQNHTDYKNLVNSKKDFDAVPEGGCKLPCGYRLPCGHSCASVCHIIDVEHIDKYKICHKDCDKIICERDHRCQKKCHYGKECGACSKMVEKLRVECQHLVRVSCSSDPSLAHCFNPCQKSRICGHKCKSLCGVFCESTPCKELVQQKSPCGHTVTIKCCDANISSRLLNACTSPCGVELMCGHLCRGSCGRCKFGRLHISCQKKCTSILICGHPCPDNCSVDCAPCRQKCTNKCVHSQCAFRCGDPCPPCMEKCNWRCEHLQCSKLCSEPCDRELCEHPNTKLIRKCQHQSIGVCGEKIPRLCRICDKDEVEEIFFGDEDEEDARFIELEDCKHVIEVKGLILWMKAEPESVETNSNNNNNNNQNSIQLKKCPKCKTIIRNTKSLNTFIQASLRDIAAVKLKTCGDRMLNIITQHTLFERVEHILKEEKFGEKLHATMRFIYQEIQNKTKLKEHEFAKPKQTLVELENKFDLVERLKRIALAFEGRQKLQQNITTEVIEKFERRLQMVASFIREFKNCNQQRADVTTELTMLELMSDVIIKASTQPFNDTGKKLLEDAFEFANKYGTATESVRKEFREMVREASKHFSGIGISVEEKEMILKAMGLSRGHWYKCQNGHVYAIGECGGAMQRSKCPECGQGIGGTSHTLDRGNAVATEMDGAIRPAWPQ